MPVLINFKICDNDPACNGVDACPTEAFHYDHKKKKLTVDESKCIECGKCACCPEGAIHFAKNDKEAKKIQKQIDDDPRKVADLFINRYGAQPIRSHFTITEDQIEQQIFGYPQSVVLELLNDDSIECLIKSNPMKDILGEFDFIKYRKLHTNDKKIIDKFKSKKLPSLIFFNNGEEFGRIEGYYGVTEREEFLEKIEDILKNDPENKN